MSVGLLVVRLLYRLYVCVHLSKWFTFSCLYRSFLCCTVVLYTCCQRLCFCSGAFSKPRPVPRNQTLNEDKTLYQHVTAPLQKHAVVARGFTLPEFLLRQQQFGRSILSLVFYQYLRLISLFLSK
jgi:hypothetical protein